MPSEDVKNYVLAVSCLVVLFGFLYTVWLMRRTHLNQDRLMRVIEQYYFPAGDDDNAS